MHIFWVFQNHENCLHSCNFSHVKYFQMLEIQILPPLLSELTFQDIEDFNMYTIFLFFESFQISSNVRNPITPTMACL
jgi:hypothetical protein